MIQFITLLLGVSAMFWVLFWRRRGMEKTLAAWRWMVFSWTGLCLVAILTPVTYYAMKINFLTALYCVAWIGGFCAAEGLAFRSHSRKLSTRRKSMIVSSMSFVGLTTLIWLYVACIVGATVFIAHDYSSFIPAISDPFQLGAVREEAGNAGDLILTIGTFLACLGLPVACIHLSWRIAMQRPPPFMLLVGLLAYFLTYILTAGRQGILIGIATFLITAAASIQMLNKPYRYKKQFYFIGAGLVCGGIAYHIVITNFRNSGEHDSFDWKVNYQNTLYDSSIDGNFLSSLEPLGLNGNGIIEMFYYFSPQLPGLSLVLQTRLPGYAFGSVQFPYVARRLESITGKKVLDPINEADDNVFVSNGMFSHFFRTAIEDTYIDFGISGGFLFICILGVMAGRQRAVSVVTKNPLDIVCGALICTGAAYTIIYSPFAENGFAFPLIALIAWFVFKRLVFISRRA